jgi:hypothetical protein
MRQMYEGLVCRVQRRLGLEGGTGEAPPLDMDYWFVATML